MNEVKGRLPYKCPSCESELKVSKLHCKECGTDVVGNYELPLLARLPEKDQRFILEFVKTSGSLKDMSQKMELSYPSVRNRLDDLIEKLINMEELL
ncbi:DUF2089 domain-containing protein [Parabacteroides sp. OttesenSCG-928-G07]|nr:DUF2089 domain-containing protein [Parabacteroides sp. OttesenSCG-928-G21]MDL2278522.1 DUF2089 domain-containing protein [Parabacteroides sp. OttesenSCG-928-G07]